MARSRVPSEKDNPLSAFDLEADTQGDHTSRIAVGRRWAGARKADTPATVEGRASRRRAWLVLGLGALALIQVPFVVMWALQPQTEPVTAAVAPAVQEPARIEGAVATTAALGTIEIVTDPPQVPISVDGQQRGSSPLTVTELTAGTYTVAARFANGTIQRQIRVEAGSTASLVMTMPRPAGVASGWIAVDAPASLQILQDGRLIGTTDVAQLMLPAGRHALEFASEELGFRAQQTVTVNPGVTSSVRLELPQAPLSINAQPWAEVWIDGERIGETPLGNVSRTIGRHQVRLRHPTLGERTTSVLVTLKEPLRIAVDLRAGK
jgi:hypothetical protein